ERLRERVKRRRIAQMSAQAIERPIVLERHAMPPWTHTRSVCRPLCRLERNVRLPTSHARERTVRPPGNAGRYGRRQPAGPDATECRTPHSPPRSPPMSTPPVWENYMAPALRVLSDGVVRKSRDIVEDAADLLGVSEEQ